jgi:signal transduction histidine kinase
MHDPMTLDERKTDETAEASYWDSLTTPKPLIFAGVVIIGVILEIVAHFILDISAVYTNFFYLIIILAGLWYQKKALWFALFFSGLYIFGEFLQTGNLGIESLIHALILCLVAVVVGSISDHIIVLRKGLISRNTQLQESRSPLVEANKKLTLLSSITRHDFNNQLTALLMSIEIAQASSQSPAMLEILAKQEILVHNIERQIAFSRDYEEIGVHAPQWQHVETLIESARREHPSPDVAIDIALDGLEIYADPLLEKIFSNLIDNSLRHGERVSRISFSYTRDGPALTGVYEDNGTGIVAPDKERIFEKGFGRHTGMGLFLSREILGITGLTIRETGAFGMGARFEIAVPEGKFRFPAKNP